MSLQLGCCLAPLIPENSWVGTPGAIGEALDAIAAAGFHSVGVGAGHVAVLDAAGESMADHLARRGLRADCIEAAINWDRGPSAALTEADEFRRLTEAIECTHVLSVTMSPTLDDPAAAQAGFNALTEALGRDGRHTALEFLPWSAIPTIAEAWRWLDGAPPTAQLLIDTWHWHRQRGGPDLETLAQVPGERIGIVQLADVAPPAHDDLMLQAILERALPGAGAVDFATVLGALRATGTTAPLLAEVLNPAQTAAAGVAATARQTFEACRRAAASGPPRR